MDEELTALVRRARRRPLWEPDATSQRLGHGRREIEKLLPHRDPFLFVDAVTDVDGDAIRGTRRIDPADPVFAGHFPGDPLYPGVLQGETMAQFALCLIRLRGLGTADVRVTKIHHAAFLAAVRPGDELTVLARLLHVDDYTATCAGQLLRGDEICALAVMEVYFVEP